MNVVITAKASDQLLKLYGYLENKYSAKVRKDFQQKLYKEIDTIKLFPLAFPSSPTLKETRRCVVSPQTSIYYLVQKDVIMIVAVLNNRRNNYE